MLFRSVVDQFQTSFGMALEHMIFERPEQPDVSVFFIGDRVVGKKAGRDLPTDIFALALPSLSHATRAERAAEDAEASEHQVQVGMTANDVNALFGAPTLRVDSAFKGRPVEYAVYDTHRGQSFGRFTFVDGVLVEFAIASAPLSQLSAGG